MERINWKGIILGGLVAGVIINVSGFLLAHSFLMPEFIAAGEKYNLPDAPGWILFEHLASRFSLGLVIVGLYAVVRPRFDRWVPAALLTGVCAWWLAYVLFALGILGFGLFSARFYVLWVVWGLGEAVAASLSGAGLHDRLETSPL